MTPEERQNALLAEADVLFAQMPNEAGLAAAPMLLQFAWLLSWLDYEVSQGSLLAYFMNSHGRYAVQTAAALDDIGASRMAHVLRRALATYEEGEAAWDARRSELAQVEEFAVVTPYRDLPNSDVLGGDLTDDYWRAADDDDWGTKLDAFIEREVHRLGRE